MCICAVVNNGIDFERYLIAEALAMYIHRRPEIMVVIVELIKHTSKHLFTDSVYSVNYLPCSSWLERHITTDIVSDIEQSDFVINVVYNRNRLKCLLSDSFQISYEIIFYFYSTFYILYTRRI